MRKTIKLTEEKLKKIDYDKIIAITVAEGGAMGDPGAVEIVTDDLELYYTHFGEIDTKLLVDKITLLKTLKVFLGNMEIQEDGWAGLYTGYGNYLFVRPEYLEPIQDYVKKKYGDTGMPLVVELYSHWFDALKDILKKQKKK